MDSKDDKGNKDDPDGSLSSNSNIEINECCKIVEAEFPGIAQRSWQRLKNCLSIKPHHRYSVRQIMAINEVLKIVIKEEYISSIKASLNISENVSSEEQLEIIENESVLNTNTLEPDLDFDVDAFEDDFLTNERTRSVKLSENKTNKTLKDKSIINQKNLPSDNISQILKLLKGKNNYSESDESDDLEDNIELPKKKSLISNVQSSPEDIEDQEMEEINLTSDLVDAVKGDTLDIETNDPSDKFVNQEELDKLCESTITGTLSEEDTNNETEDENVTAKNKKQKKKVVSYSSSSDLDCDIPKLDFSKVHKLLEDADNLLCSDDENSNKSTSIHHKSNNSDSEAELSFTKRSKKRIISDDESESDTPINSIEKKKIIDKTVESKKSTDEESSNSSKNFQKKKNKRKRIIPVDISSDDGGVNSDSSIDSSSSLNTSRKKINKIIGSDRLNKETINAEKAEKERRKRIEEKQKLYNQFTNDEKVETADIGPVILDFDTETKEPLVQIDQAFVKILKPHQIQGVKFMYDCTIESVQRLKKHNHSSGCILAHSMGLGKTLQVVVFLHTLLHNQHIKNTIKTVLILVPLNVIKNWANEFYKWFEECKIVNEMLIFEILTVKPEQRNNFLRKWKEKGGIMLMTSHLFSKMTLNDKKKIHMSVINHLLDPGPDMIIIDEGHLLKNGQSALNRSISRIKTLRRIILTGTPLQNNLSEYFTMVDFVKPNLLGTLKEFRNRFENPISNGQHIDSTNADVTLMKRRAHILHKLLKDCIHRCDYNILVPYLEKKYEYVLTLRLTSTQAKMYKYYLDNFVRKEEDRFVNLFVDYQILSKIWNHPSLVLKKEPVEMVDDSLDNFIVYSDCESDSSNSNRSKTLLKNGPEIELNKNADDRNLNADQPDGNPHDQKWCLQFLPEDAYQMDLSVKFTILFSIIEKAEVIGDKLLIFSQSLANLDLIEFFLSKKMTEYNERYGVNTSYEELIEITGGISHRWIPDIDYFRIDGKVKWDDRSKIIDKFNDPDNLRARLVLISTRAGGIGTNLIGANRCIIFDASWNPSNDTQAIFRIFRYGQKKPVYVYRFKAFGTMESKIYERQINKQSLSHRVIDEQQIKRHYKSSSVKDLYTFEEYLEETTKLPNLPKDNLLADIFLEHKDLIVSYHEHDSLLENRPEEELNEEEQQIAWTEYENDRKRSALMLNDTSINNPMGPVQQMPTPIPYQNVPRPIMIPNVPNMYPFIRVQSNTNQIQSNQIPSASQYIYVPRNIDPKQEKPLVKDVFRCGSASITIDDNTIIGMVNQNIETFEKEFYLILAEKKVNINPPEAPWIMFNFLEKCRSIATKAIERTRNPERKRFLQNGSEYLESIHYQFIKKYKDFFMSTKYNNSQMNVNIGNNENKTIECIEVPDD